MTRQEALKILAVLRVAYPNSYRGLDEDMASAMAGLWTSQFANMPYSVVSLAVERLISKSTFPPTIAEVNDELRSLWAEATTLLDMHEQSYEWGMLEHRLNESTVKTLKTIEEATSPMRSGKYEVPLAELIRSKNLQLTAENKKIEKKR
nr:MAG TPA: replisome organizer [Caudoviricetes sp.]